MEIELVHLSKRFGYQWILKDVNFVFPTNRITGIAGRNGSGKSTLIKLVSGMVTPSEGKVLYTKNNQIIPPSNFYKYFSWVAPYTDIVQEFTLKEMFLLHSKFKPMKINSFTNFIQSLAWDDTGEKQIRFYSSGMKQKLQLALAVLSDTPVLLLDEPTSYLDEYAKKWFSDLLHQFGQDRTIIISSNDAFDLHLCQQVSHIEELNGQKKI